MDARRPPRPRIRTLLHVASLILAAAAFGHAQGTGEYYKLTAPGDGDVFYIGDTVEVKIDATGMSTTGLKMVWGRYEFNLPENLDATGTFLAAETPSRRFIVPEYFAESRWDQEQGGLVADTIVPVSDSIKIVLFEYNTLETLAETEGYFAIRASRPNGDTTDSGGCGSGLGLALLPPIGLRLAGRARRRRRA